MATVTHDVQAHSWCTNWGVAVVVLRRSQAPYKILATATEVTMIVRRGLTAAAITAVSALGFASSAWADVFSGTYSLNLNGASGAPTSWTARSACPPSGGCVAHITSSSGWSGDAQLAGDRWTMTVDRPDGQSCPDGTRHSELQTWSWDTAALTGQVSGVSTDPAACPQGPINSFTLTKVLVG
jgi:hypothetical protein